MTPQELAAAFLGTAVKVQNLANHEPSWWLRTRLVDLDTRARSGALPTCPHPSPYPLVIGLWAPDRAWCVPCYREHVRPTDPDEAYRCDRCSSIDRDQLHGCALPGLGCVLLFGLCRACYAREVPA